MGPQLFHTDIVIPKICSMQVPKRIVDVEYSYHARMESKKDRYGNIPIPNKLDISDAKLIEVEAIDLKVTKFVVRKSISDKTDAVYVLRPLNHHHKTYICVTVWLNSKDDKHRTLDESKYVRRDQLKC